MKAFIFERTGEPSEVLSLREIALPTPGPGEVLVRIRFSPVHPTDLHVQRGRFGRQPERLASGALKLPPAAIYQPSQIKDALREAEASAREGKPLLCFS